MTAFMKAIPGNLMHAGRGALNTLSLGAEKFSNSSLWQNTAGLATPYFKSAAAYWPQPLRFNVISKDAAGGAILTVLFGAAVNKARS